MLLYADRDIAEPIGHRQLKLAMPRIGDHLLILDATPATCFRDQT